MDYTLADLVKITGARRRTLQLWAEGRVLEALPTTERQGTGTHRRFDRNEAIVACLLHGFARKMQMPIGVLLRISELLRRMAHKKDLSETIERAIQGNRVWLSLRGDGAPRFVVKFADGSTDESFHLILNDFEWETEEETIKDSIYQNTLEAADTFGGFLLTIGMHSHLEGLR